MAGFLLKMIVVWVAFL